MHKVLTCKARQFSDQMCCDKCALQWDVNDPDPPECKSELAGTTAIAQMRESCAQQSRGAVVPLLFLKEMPLNALPTFGLQPSLRQVNWSTQPTLRYCSISRPSGCSSPSTRFMFYGELGEVLIEVVRADDFAGGSTNVRHYHDGKPGEWRA